MKRLMKGFTLIELMIVVAIIDIFKYGTQATANMTGTGASACSTVNVVPGPSGAAFTATAQGQIDNDTTIDLWSISTDSRTMACDVGANVASGEPANDVNDVN